MTSPWVATADSFYSQKTTFHDSMLKDGFFHVLTTGRTKPAVCGKQRRNQVLVKQYRKYGYLAQVGFEHGANQMGQLCTN